MWHDFVVLPLVQRYRSYFNNVRTKGIISFKYLSQLYSYQLMINWGSLLPYFSSFNLLLSRIHFRAKGHLFITYGSLLDYFSIFIPTFCSLTMVLEICSFGEPVHLTSDVNAMADDDPMTERTMASTPMLNASHLSILIVYLKSLTMVNLSKYVPIVMQNVC